MNDVRRRYKLFSRHVTSKRNAVPHHFFSNYNLQQYFQQYAKMLQKCHRNTIIL